MDVHFLYVLELKISEIIILLSLCLSVVLDVPSVDRITFEGVSGWKHKGTPIAENYPQIKLNFISTI